MTIFIKSKLREKVLVYYFSHPKVSEYVRELAKNIKADPTNLSRELKKLEKEGLFTSEYRGKQKYYKLNDKFSLFKEYKNIIAKTIGIEYELKESMEKIKEVKFCFIYGSYAAGKDNFDSDIDLFIIGNNVNVDFILDKIGFLERKINREINHRIFSIADFNKAIKEKNSFILNIIKKEKIFIKGDEKDFTKFNK